MPPVIIPENNKVSDILRGVPESINPSGIAGGYNASSSFIPAGVSSYTIPPLATTFNVDTTVTATETYASQFLSSESSGTYFATTEAVKTIVTNTYLVGWWNFTGFTRSIA
jgi:hypothetical protein